MLQLAVTTDAETFDRMSEPLANRGIETVHLPVTGRTIPLTDNLSSDRFDAGFVFPGRLMEGGAVDALLDIPWLNNRTAILRSRNKAEVIARLATADVPVPQTKLISNPVDDTDLLAAFRAFDGPVLLKPNSTTRGNGIVRIDTAEQLRGITDHLELVHAFPATADKSYLLQEYLPDARDIRVMVLNGEYVGAVERSFPQDNDRVVRNVHRGAEATGIDLQPSLRHLAETVAQTLSIPFVGVDLLVSEQRAVVVETNARPTIDETSKYVDGFYNRLADSIRQISRS